MRPDLEPTQRIPTLSPREAPEIGQGQPAPSPEGKNPLAWLLGALLRVLLLLVLLVGALVAAALLLTPTRESILLLGSDARPDELARGQVGRTDTLLVLVADRATPRLAMLSVPRDLWVAVPGYGEERVNAAYELGGSQTAKQTVSNVLGQRIDRFALIGLQGVRDIVDAAGGIDVTVPQRIYDDQYPTDDYGYQTVDIPAGRQHMDGDTALKYARTRHQDSDFGRIARQQQVLGAVRSAMLNPLNWPRVPAVATAVQASIRSDVSPFDAIAIGAAMLRAAGDPERLVLDTNYVEPFTGEGGAFLLRPRPELRPAVARFLTLNGSVPANVEVLNGAAVGGLARTTADRLTQRGFTVVSVGDADRPQAQTTILVKPVARAAGEQVAQALGVPTSRVTDSDALSQSDIRVLLGSDAHP